ncbi:Putative proteasome inhibitor [Trachymyrmex septentrionalis]|uniref:Proteasome inhibitor PI31 subunit n=1 Tax=Trachymyrmex septentrionalis TaxID=34720 RepID=A0A195FER9_9HYME|nr:PREDICTED: proteasome inhibitor PI31 subunit isoform X2 [Trachymyrmex septentrionalis]KYN39170.1 Putative proteasome inhibitor [Trachymyrmex septentrionalis]
MIDVTNVFGFELFQKLYHDDIHKKEDVIILFMHWYLTKSGFRCIGIGDDATFNASEKGSELIPTEWNSRPSYALRYVKDGKLHVLLGVKSDTDLLLNFMKHQDNSVSNISFPIEETVSALHGPLETVIPSYQTILHNVQKDFVSMICSNEAGTQTTVLNSPGSSSGTNEVPPIDSRADSPSSSGNRALNRPEYVDVGSRDLNPFGEGSGMIFDPYSQRRRQMQRPRIPYQDVISGLLPLNAVPPGARFDPFGPPEPDLMRPHRRRPDDDHLPPPQYDDMFL